MFRLSLARVRSRLLECYRAHSFRSKLRYPIASMTCAG
jgi:hypothetical protein